MAWRAPRRGPLAEVAAEPEHQIDAVALRAWIDRVLLDELALDCLPEVFSAAFLYLHRHVEILVRDADVRASIVRVDAFGCGLNAHPSQPNL